MFSEHPIPSTLAEQAQPAHSVTAQAEQLSDGASAQMADTF